ncbi:ABC transporter substrate-binding protein, partial [Paraburkholderia sp.]|uniref:ABC transporter substrate-binding protein n=1 Tax=Paraburkholderia sp. TaxID=1926495 RepID=UPI0038621B99
RDDRVDIFRASALRGFSNALSLEGLSTRDVELVDVQARTLQSADLPRDRRPPASPDGFSSRSLYEAEAAALLRGEVDAIYVKGSTGLEVAQLIGAHVVIDIGFHPDRRIRNNNGTPRPLTVNADVLAQHPDIVEGFLKLVVDAGEWARTHPDETAEYVTQETASSIDWVRAAYGANLHTHLGVNLDSESIAALADFKDFLYEWDLLEADFDVNDWIDPRPLDAVLAPTLRKHA